MGFKACVLLQARLCRCCAKPSPKCCQARNRKRQFPIYGPLRNDPELCSLTPRIAAIRRTPACGAAGCRSFQALGIDSCIQKPQLLELGILRSHWSDHSRGQWTWWPHGLWEWKRSVSPRDTDSRSRYSFRAISSMFSQNITSLLGLRSCMCRIDRGISSGIFLNLA